MPVLGEQLRPEGGISRTRYLDLEGAEGGMYLPAVVPVPGGVPVPLRDVLEEGGEFLPYDLLEHYLERCLRLAHDPRDDAVRRPGNDIDGIFPDQASERSLVTSKHHLKFTVKKLFL